MNYFKIIRKTERSILEENYIFIKYKNKNLVLCQWQERSSYGRYICMSGIIHFV